MASQANLDHNKRERAMHAEDYTYQMKLSYANAMEAAAKANKEHNDKVRADRAINPETELKLNTYKATKASAKANKERNDNVRAAKAIDLETELQVTNYKTMEAAARANKERNDNVRAAKAIDPETELRLTTHKGTEASVRSNKAADEKLQIESFNIKQENLKRMEQKAAIDKHMTIRQDILESLTKILKTEVPHKVNIRSNSVPEGCEELESAHLHFCVHKHLSIRPLLKERHSESTYVHGMQCS